MPRDLTTQALTLPVRKTPVYSQAASDDEEYLTLALGPGQTSVELTATTLFEEALASGKTKHGTIVRIVGFPRQLKACFRCTRYSGKLDSFQRAPSFKY